MVFQRAFSPTPSSSPSLSLSCFLSIFYFLVFFLSCILRNRILYWDSLALKYLGDIIFREIKV